MFAGPAARRMHGTASNARSSTEFRLAERDGTLKQIFSADGASRRDPFDFCIEGRSISSHTKLDSKTRVIPMVDFSRLLDADLPPPPVEPTTLFQSLVRNPPLDGYLRNVQSEVLQTWHQRRAERDVIIKMNTGSGKTVVGLLILQSLLNESIGPALYLCPNSQLVDQVVDQARALGVKLLAIGAGDDLPTEFINREAILVTTFQKLFNGRSVFGAPGSSRSPVKLGAVLVDDAHSCLTIARQTATVSLPRTNAQYRRLVELFLPAIKSQSEGKAAEISRGHPRALAQVPYWAWIDSVETVAGILAAARDTDPLLFSWDLIKDDLKACHCHITGDRLEITPHLVPIDAIPSFARADRRYFLSATLVDDAVLMREFGVSESAVTHTIRPSLRGDIGERLILAPALVDPGLSHQMPQIAARIAKGGHNVVILVPSFAAAGVWEESGAQLFKGDSVGAAVNTLRQGRGYCYVFANRYDGIDLPDDACRILILDGLPLGESLLDQHVAAARADSPLLRARVVQTIEQGLGRGIRSGSDYCAVLVCGDVVSLLGTTRMAALLSAETRRQVEIGRQAARLAKDETGSGWEKLKRVIDQSLQRDKGWRDYHARMMTGLPDSVVPYDSSLALTERRASELFRMGAFLEAAEEIRGAVNSDILKDDADKGWYLQLAASYTHPADPARAQELQRKAHELNRSLLKPAPGVQYRKVSSRAGLQADRALRWVQEFTEPNAVVVAIQTLASRLVFGSDHDDFEAAWKELGTVLGFESQRPEAEYGVGPDNLWRFADNSYLMTEAKNEVSTDRAEVSKSEVAQLSVSQNWFVQEYCDAPLTLAIVHPADTLADDAFAPEGAGVLTQTGLERLRQRLTAFAAAVASRPLAGWTAVEIGRLLNAHRLDPPGIRTGLFVPLKRPR